MVTLTKIYTRGGDKGQTSLVGGRRVSKHDPRIAAYGTVDEANSVIGLVRLHTTGDIDAMLGRIQNELFDLGADLANPDSDFDNAQALRILPVQTARLEAEIDAMNADLASLNSFILPGGSPASAYLHLARTVVRRAERLTVEAAEAEAINPEAVKYINRLSDLLFVLGRKLNDNGAGDILWKPGATR
ncbi:cob(I)yrinic acid a,c-diamide adenosyltransferase [Govanella unica]|uniref:Corrinoid adenosyltransferase n=1 Tax=Govanella unica TaxID=2975056 RepID=A0A9X3TVW4_9PROT|nr:cob(I)yrinic acid a,c-diamide adenosyltransferase [Govania unica]MDA5192623.1 cob(I)yrinic acid a,c-diamide adenosyltransferase [Govania unica]